MNEPRHGQLKKEGSPTNIRNYKTSVYSKPFFGKKVKIEDVFFSKEILDALLNYENIRIDGIRISVMVNPSNELELFLYPHILSEMSGPIPGPGVGN